MKKMRKIKPAFYDLRNKKKYFYTTKPDIIILINKLNNL